MQGKREDQFVNLLIACTVLFIKFGREVLDTAAANVKPGVSPDEIDRIVHEVRKVIIHDRFLCQITFFVMVNFACLGLY